MASISIIDKAGKKAGSLQLEKGIFDAPVRTAVLQQAVLKYRAGARQGTVATKNMVDVSGGGRKPHRQKGTGQARQGSGRSPLMKGGGVTFGPQPRDFNYTLPKKILKAALRESLNAKFKDGDLVGISELTEPFEKTKEFATVIRGLDRRGKTIALLEGSHESVLRVSRNIPRFEIIRAADVNAYDILRAKTLVVTKTAFDILMKRIAS